MEASSLLDKVSNGRQDLIDVGDVMCPICLSILIDPVKMPCDHILCMPCFEKNVDQSSLNCPICRKRISVWCRKAKKEGALVYTDLWRIIKEKFAARVEARLAGLDDVDADEIVPCLPMHQFVNAGAIKSEFDEKLEEERQEMLRMQTEEEKKSLELIRKLEQEEREERERELEAKRQQEEVDMDMARKIMESPDDSPKKMIRGKENKAATVRGPLDNYFGSPEVSKKKSLSNTSAMSPFTRPQKFEPKLLKPGGPSVERCPSTESIQSNNSIDAELNHFKPIRSAPLSPPKRLPDGSVLEPQVVKTQPRNLTSQFSSSPGPSRSSPGPSGSKHEVRRLSASTIVKESKVPVTPRPESATSHGDVEPESLFCDETLRLTLTPTPSPSLKARRLVSPSRNNNASPVFKHSMEMDTQNLGEIMEQGYDSLDPSIIEEQKRMEEQIKQQLADERFAKLLQEDLDRQERSVNRKKGSPDEYNLRDSAKKLPAKPRMPLSPRTPKNSSLSCKSKLDLTPKTGVKSKLGLSARKASMSAIKRLREEEGSSDEETRTPKAKKNRRMSMLEAAKKMSVESSGNESEEF